MYEIAKGLDSVLEQEQKEEQKDGTYKKARKAYNWITGKRA